MDLKDTILTCAVNLQWINTSGIVGRRLTHKAATLRLLRDDKRALFLEITPAKCKSIKLHLKDVIVHKKFMSEGKAAINFKREQCTMYLSNAPPGPLIIFLRTLFVKLNGEQMDEACFQKQLRTHMLSDKPSTFEEVSPVTTSEMILARKKVGLMPSRATLTTPSPIPGKKRRFADLNGDETLKSNQQGLPVAKKLYEDSTTLLLTEGGISLCSEQRDVLQACVSGKSVFFTGSAGTGKSFLLRKIIETLPPEGTVATASTGVAACLIGGVTLHAFCGIGSGEATLQRCFEMASRPVAAQTWRKCKRLIIDEISMVEGKYFDKIEAVARHIRRNDRPFGGIQLIICGDFLQLPPVFKRQDPITKNTTDSMQRFCFQSDAWETCIDCVFELKDVHRQSDSEFISILNNLRIGHINDKITQRLIATSKQIIESNGILATQLCSHTADADSINENRLENLPGERILFRAEDSDPKMTKQLDAQIQAPAELFLKINAQVMLLKNINIAAGLVNGARGVVIDIKKGIPVVRFKNQTEYACKHERWIIKTPNSNVITRRQIPLKLAWAFSIHKSQGLTLDCVEISLSKVFEAGQAYVALSRAKSLDSVRILDFDAKQVWANSLVLQYYRQFRKRLNDNAMIPLGTKYRNDKIYNKTVNENNTDLSKLKKSIMNKPLVTIS